MPSFEANRPLVSQKVLAVWRPLCELANGEPWRSTWTPCRCPSSASTCGRPERIRRRASRRYDPNESWPGPVHRRRDLNQRLSRAPPVNPSALHPAVHRELFTDLPPRTRVPITRSRQIDLVRLAKKVQRSGASPGGGSGARQRASSGAGASTSSARPWGSGRHIHPEATRARHPRQPRQGLLRHLQLRQVRVRGGSQKGVQETRAAASSRQEHRAGRGGRVQEGEQGVGRPERQG